MRPLLLSVSAASFILAAAPVFAQSDDTTTTTTVVKDKGSAGAGAGAAGGAIAGAAVAGPVGALVGAVAGGAAGAAVDPPREVKTYITTQQVAPVSYNGDIAVGQVLPDEVTVYDVPNYDRYRWTYINGQRLLIDRRDRKIVAVVNE